MPRTTGALIREILAVDVSLTDLDPFIAVANVLVTEQCAGSTTYDEPRLTLIETWLAAHFVCMRDPRATQERAGSVGATYQSKVDLGFNTSHYGQMALRLDSEGGLAALEQAMLEGKATTASGIGVVYLGTVTDSQETAYART